MKKLYPPFFVFIISVTGLFLIIFGVSWCFHTVYSLIDYQLVKSQFSNIDHYRDEAAVVHYKAFYYALVPMTIVFSAAGFLFWNAIISAREMISNTFRKGSRRYLNYRRTVFEGS